MTLPGVLIRLLVVAVLFRLNSAKKWHLVLRRGILPEPLRQWLGIESLADLVDQATVDWIPAKLLLDTAGDRMPDRVRLSAAGGRDSPNDPGSFAARCQAVR